MATTVLGVAIRIARALERLADAAERLTLEPAPPPDPTPMCPHDRTLALGLTTGWICQDCGHQELPS